MLIISLNRQYMYLFICMFQVAGVKDTFAPRDYVVALQSMHREYGNSVLDKDRLKLALQLVSFLNDSVAELNQTLNEVKRVSTLSHEVRSVSTFSHEVKSVSTFSHEWGAH